MWRISRHRPYIYIYICIYTHICMSLSIYIYIYAVESKLGPRFGLFWVKTWSKVASKLGPRFCFACLPLFYSVFLAFLKSQVVCRGAKKCFAGCRGVKKGFCKKGLFCPFCAGERKRERMKNGKGKKTEKLCFWVVVIKKVYIVKVACLENRQTRLVFGR